MRNVLAALLVAVMVWTCSPAEPPGESQPPEVTPLPRCEPSAQITVDPAPMDKISISLDLDPIPDVRSQTMVCWTVKNNTNSDIIVELADFKHLQFKDNEKGPEKYLDPLVDGRGGDRGVKRTFVKANQSTDSNDLIRTMARKMFVGGEFDYNGCYKYSVYVAKAGSKPTDAPWSYKDPRLEYDDDGRGVEGQTTSSIDRCLGTPN